MLTAKQRRVVRAMFKENTGPVIDLLQVKQRIRNAIDENEEDGRVGVRFRFDCNDGAVCYYVTPAGVMAVGQCISDVMRINHNHHIETSFVPPSSFGFH